MSAKPCGEPREKGQNGPWNGPQWLDGLAFVLPIQALGESGREAALHLIPLGRFICHDR